MTRRLSYPERKKNDYSPVVTLCFLFGVTLIISQIPKPVSSSTVGSLIPPQRLQNYGTTTESSMDLQGASSFNLGGLAGYPGGGFGSPLGGFGGGYPGFGGMGYGHGGCRGGLYGGGFYG